MAKPGRRGDWEVWEGVLHVGPWPDGGEGRALTPEPTIARAAVRQQLAELLGPAARASGLVPVIGPLRLGSEDDYRVPDGALLRDGEASTGGRVALVLELVASGDETSDKFSFYATHGVDEVVMADAQERRVDWLALMHGGEYGPVERSGLIALGPDELAGQIDWQ